MPSIVTSAEDTSERRLEFWRDVVSQSFVPLEALPRETPDFRAELRTARIGPVQVSVITAQPHAIARTRRHIGSAPPDYVKVNLLFHGRCVLSQGGNQTELGAGDLVVYDTRRPYSLDLDRPYRGLVLMFPRDLLRMPERDLARVTATRVPCHEGVGTLVRPFLDGLVRQVEQSESLDTPRLGHNVADLIGTLLTEYMGVDRAPGDEGRDLLVRRILTYMEQRLDDPALGPDEIAAAHRVSRRHLYKLMAEEGYTVSGWLRDQRLARCRRDLGDPALRHLSVGAIGGRWGFPDPAHFSHAFKAAYGMSPREVRTGRAPHPPQAGRG
ncbi:helix-turn-helix domain-containing protein [Streptomyces sp. NPDC057438]|uniref:AraC-like ligand-binding domain-containing protein n=1 Tax=Streptomyces sp. NPDC057438 TaxID=3346133 RepID=UPI0036B4EBB2